MVSFGSFKCLWVKWGLRLTFLEETFMFSTLTVNYQLGQPLQSLSSNLLTTVSQFIFEVLLHLLWNLTACESQFNNVNRPYCKNTWSWKFLKKPMPQGYYGLVDYESVVCWCGVSVVSKLFNCRLIEVLITWFSLLEWTDGGCI